METQLEMKSALSALLSGNKVNQTYSTRNYSMFKRLEGNRHTNPVHVKRLEESIHENGMLEVDIIVNEKGEVIDGQNRLEAAINCQALVYYKVCVGYGLREAQVFNKNVKKWLKVDHLESYCERGFPEYIKFKQFRLDFPNFNFLVCERILTLCSSQKQEVVSGNKTLSQYFETGNLIIQDLEKSYEVATQIMGLKDHFMGYNNGTFVSAMLSIFQNKDFNYKELVKKLQTNGGPRLTFCRNMELYKLGIENIYNFHRSQKVNLRY